MRITRGHVALGASLLLAVAACVLPCFGALFLSPGIPAQDPPPHIIAAQNEQQAAYERLLTGLLWAGGFLLVAGLASGGYGLAHILRHRRVPPR